MKTPFLQLRGLSIWAALGLFILTNSASGEPVLENFKTETGKCTLTEKIELLDQLEGAADYSYTLDSTKIYQSGVGSTGTDITIPPLTRLNCLARKGDKMLVTAAEQNKIHCGWVEVDSLLEANAENDLAFPPNVLPCGIIKAISIRDFCAKMKEIHGVVEGCSLKSVGRSVLKTKFITDNADTVTDKITVYSSSQSMEAIGKIGIFTNLEVFDLAKNQSTGAIRFLVGISGKNLKGWVDYRSGTVITSNLSVYFSASGTEDIYQSAIGVRNNEILAQRPKT